MEHFGFSFLHELAARNLFKILMPTLDQIVFIASTSCKLGMFGVYLGENVTFNWFEL